MKPQQTQTMNSPFVQDVNDLLIDLPAIVQKQLEVIQDHNDYIAQIAQTRESENNMTK